MKVLVIDCNRDFLDSVAVSLKRYNYNVFCAEDFYSAAKLLNSLKFDLVVAEVQNLEPEEINIIEYVKTVFPESKLLIKSSYYTERDIPPDQIAAKPFTDISYVSNTRRLSN